MALSFLVFGLRSSIYEPPKRYDRLYDVEVKDPSRTIDVLDMAHEVKKPLNERVRLYGNDIWDIDGVLRVYRRNKSAEWQQKGREMALMAAGSLLLALATAGVSWYLESRIFSLVTLVALGALFILSYYRKTQAADQYAIHKALEKEVPFPQETFAKLRADHYPATAQDVFKREVTNFFSTDDVLLPNPIFHPDEGKLFFRMFFREWTDTILKASTLQEKRDAVSAFLMISEPFTCHRLQVNAALFLVDASQEKSQLFHDLMPLFDQHWKLQEEIFEYQSKLYSFKCMLMMDLTQRFVKQAPAMDKAKYRDLALDAALPEEMKNLLKRFDKSDEMIYQKVTLFVSKAIAFAQHPQKQFSIEEITLEPFEKFELPKKIDFLPFDNQWVVRAKLLKPQNGNPEEYLQFVDQIAQSSVTT